MQRDQYVRLLVGSDDCGEQKSGKHLAQSTKKVALERLLVHLRQICTTPYSVPGVQPDPYVLGSHVFETSGKLMVLKIIIHDIVLSQRKKMIIFSGFLSSLDVVEDLIHVLRTNKEDLGYTRVEGGMGIAQREFNIRKFQDPKSSTRIILTSIRANGEGITLTAAHHVVFLDEDWNPQVTLQAESRAHRIGQTEPVTIYKLLTRGTVEEQMQRRIMKKLYLSLKVNELSKPQSQPVMQDHENGSGLDASQLRALIQRSTATFDHTTIDISDLEDWPLVKVLDQLGQGEGANEEVESEAAGDFNEEHWLAEQERVEVSNFEGQKHLSSSMGSTEKADDTILNLPKAARRIGKETTMNIGGFPVAKHTIQTDKTAEKKGSAKMSAQEIFGHEDVSFRAVLKCTQILTASIDLFILPQQHR